MQFVIDPEELKKQGLSPPALDKFVAVCEKLQKESVTKEEFWQKISKTILPAYSFPIHVYIFNLLFPNWQEHPETAPAWIPDQNTIHDSNLWQFMQAAGAKNLDEFHQWSTSSYESFWLSIIEKLNIQFKEKPSRICDLSKGLEEPNWLPDAKLNISDSCFNASKNAIAIYEHQMDKRIKTVTFAELNLLSNRIANSLIKRNFKPGDAFAIVMPMNTHAIAIYLGIIKMGGVVVSVADSFSAQEMAMRFSLAKTKAVFIQDTIYWNGKEIPLYQKLFEAETPQAVVIPLHDNNLTTLRSEDSHWHDFLVNDDSNVSHPCSPMNACNILFSSGTTGEPKAIPWNHTTGIKAASDAFFHQNIKPADILCWPTNLGWMMGPWLIFAAFINKASVALYPDLPRTRQFGEFIQNAKVTMLGVVPTLVAAWRESACMENLDWSCVTVFSSTGECSNAFDMFYLMSLAQYKPVIEYCGGTEIGGAYISSTVIQNNHPSLFSTPTMGMNFIILDEDGVESDDGEVAIIPPSIGLSTTLLNADHHHVYFENMPVINQVLVRRHGDQIRRFDNAYYAVLGRVDDTMNLGGIKISAAEIERTLSGIPAIYEIAAVAVSQRPSQLIIFASTDDLSIDKKKLKQVMQARINKQLNPLFKIHDIVLTPELPKTASNKIMRRVLRKKYMS